MASTFYFPSEPPTALNTCEKQSHVMVLSFKWIIGFYVFQIWRKYDADSSGFISAAELCVSVAGSCLWANGRLAHPWEFDVCVS